MTGPDLFDAVELHLGRYVSFPSEHERVAATLWVVHTHALDAFDSTPRLAALSPEPGSGKTRLLEVIETLVPAPMHVLSASTAAIFRTIEAERPVLLLDEVDSIFGRRGKDENNEDLRALLNAGHRGGATIPRCVGPTHDVRRFPVYAAVALAGLGDLPDTLMSRSVVIRMKRRAPHEHVRPFRTRVDEAIGHALRDQLATWAETVTAQLEGHYPTMPDGIDDRPADVWEPLLAVAEVADVADGRWTERAREACVALAGSAVSRQASLGIRLLTDLRTVFGGAEDMTTAAALDALHGLDESPWADLRGKPLDSRGLSSRLGQYGIASKNLVRGEHRPKGYTAEDLYDSWQRYVPEDQADDGDPLTGVPASATSATSATNPDEVAPVADVAHPRTPEWGAPIHAPRVPA